MIFVTTGTQAPFDRLIKAVDEILPFLNGEEVIAQSCAAEYKPINMKTVEFLSPAAFFDCLIKADLIVSHAGMGTVISAMSASKPIIVMPRLASLREHRNDHQLATVKKLKEMNFGKVVNSPLEMKNAIFSVLQNVDEQSVQSINKFASEELLESISGYINSIR